MGKYLSEPEKYLGDENKNKRNWNEWYIFCLYMIAFSAPGTKSLLIDKFQHLKWSRI